MDVCTQYSRYLQQSVRACVAPQSFTRVVLNVFLYTVFC